MELIKKEFTFGETKGFYPVLEGIYNNNPMLRNIVEQKCETKFKKMPMVNKVADDTLIQQMLQYLDQFAPEFLPVFEYYKKSLPVNTGEMLRRKLSPGISLRLAPLPLLLQKAIDQFNLSYAANYAAPNGQTAAVYSLRILEGLLVGDDPFIYPPNGIYITEGGATNGIYTAFEYIRRKFPGSEILICGPGYFQFFENAKYDLKAKVLINPDAQNDGEVKFLPSPKQIEKSVFQYGDGKFYVGGTTKALIITQPNNPTGEFYCKKDLTDAHSSKADTAATFEVLKSQLDRYNDLENDIEKLADFGSYNTNVDFAGRIILDEEGVEIFNFGKYKGKAVELIFHEDPAYYSWMMNGDFPLYTKKVLTEIKLRSFGKKL